MSPPTAELRKRKRERRIAMFIAAIFVISLLSQALIASRRQAYGFVDSLLYFGLLDLNVFLIMFLVFLISRNIIKAWLVRRSGKLGGSLRWRMVTSLLAFSLLPSVLLFAGSSYVIRTGFDRWFSSQVGKALSDAQAITTVHYDGIQENLTFYSTKLTKELQAMHHIPTSDDIVKIRESMPIQAVELYTDLVSPPLRSLKEKLPDWAVPRAAVDSLQRALAGESFSLTRQYGDGDLVQEFVSTKMHPVSSSDLPGILPEQKVVLVLSHTVPLGLKTRIGELQTAFKDYQHIAIFKDTHKTNYTLALVTLFVLVLFVVSWFGMYIAKSVTEPVSELLKGTEAFREGQWDYRIPTTVVAEDKNLAGAGADLEVLKAAFNLMAREVGRRGRQLEEANAQLVSLVRELEDRERYLEILLSSIRRGVLVVDPMGTINRANAEVMAFATESERSLELAEVLGRGWREVFSALGTPDESRAWLAEASARTGHPIDRIFEVVSGSGRSVNLRSVRSTCISLLDERGMNLGWLIILEDVSDAARLEKLAAWQEVARRVAHEIKNPLTPIQISIDRLHRRMSEKLSHDMVDGPVFRECVQQIQKQVRVIRDLVREFSQFAKLPEPHFATLDIGRLLHEILEDYRFTHPTCRFVFENHHRGPVWIRADAEYMRRLVVNLADNALHSMEDAKSPDPQFCVNLGLSDKGFVAIAFEDNGPGIPPALQPKIFDPYVTSKASGLGLGLPIVRRIAIEHMGRVRCEEAQGGRFVLELPLLPVEDVEGQEKHS